MIKVVALDVDGVIVDSVHEVFVVCQKVLEERGEKLEDAYEKSFMQGRNLLRTAKDFYAIIKMRDTDFDSITQEDFDNFVEEHEDESKKFSTDFFAMRKKFQDEALDKWLSLNSIYPGIDAVIKKLSEKFTVVIASTKDLNSIKTFLEKNNIHIDDNHILSKEISEDKTEQMKIISEKFSANFKEIFFIDDNPKNLMPVKDLGVKVSLSGWGYSNERQKQEVREEGVNIIEKPEDMEKEIKALDKN